MYKSIIYLFFILISTAHASKNEILDSIVLNSEIDKKVKVITSSLQNYFKQNSNIKFNKSYQEAIIKEEIKDELNFSMSLKELVELNNWYTSELGIKIKSLNEIIITPEKTKELFTNLEAVHNKNRFIKISHIESKLNISQFDFDLLKIFVLNNNNSKKIEELKTKMRNQSLVFLDYKYKILTYEELNRYYGFLSSQTTQKFIKLYREKLLESIKLTLKSNLEKP